MHVQLTISLLWQYIVPQNDLLTVQIYMESQCRDTKEFIDNQLIPNWNELKSFINLEVIPFGKATIEEAADGSKTFQCQHHQLECDVNRLMCCAIARLETADKYLDYIQCAQMKSIEATEPCAAASGLDHGELMECAQGKEGETLHNDAGVKTLEHQLTFIPAIFLSGTNNPNAFRYFSREVCRVLASTTEASDLPTVC